MNDRRLEELLRGYRPVDPPARLRDRIVAAGAPEGAVWPWLIAAAALLALTVGLHVNSARTRAGLSPEETAMTTTFTEEQRDLLRSIYGEAADVVADRAQRSAALEKREALASQPEVLAWP